MRTNTPLTIYNKYVSASTKKEAYQLTHLSCAEWEDRKAVNLLRSGGDVLANQASIFIPFTIAEYSTYKKPLAWDALSSKTGFWTLRVGDYIVKGTVSDVIQTGFTIVSLINKYDNVLMVTTVDTMDMGSFSLQHWKIGAR